MSQQHLFLATVDGERQVLVSDSDYPLSEFIKDGLVRADQVVDIGTGEEGELVDLIEHHPALTLHEKLEAALAIYRKAIARIERDEILEISEVLKISADQYLKEDRIRHLTKCLTQPH